jgi:L-galactono-1,4-lactone dehydrogenase
VIEALRPHGLTLPNLASIAEQQFGGFVQVGAHGTGRLVAPVDNYVTRLKLVTPGLGTVVLSKEKDGLTFEMAKVGLGCLGVVVELTMECIPAHRLVEHTFVLTRAEAKTQLDFLLKKHKHMRYMWIPYSDAVVVVTNDPEDSVPADIPRHAPPPGDQATRNKALIDLLAKFCKEYGKPFSIDEVQEMGFGELRGKRSFLFLDATTCSSSQHAGFPTADALLAFDPLDINHVKRCNQAEAEFWASNEGYQTKPSDELLQFDCGGQVSISLRATSSIESC